MEFVITRVYCSTNSLSTTDWGVSITFICKLKTNICDEWVCSMETSGTMLTPEDSSPHCVAKWGVSGFNEEANDLKILLSPWIPVPVHMSVAPTSSAFGKTWQGNSVQGQRIVALVSMPQTTIVVNVRLNRKPKPLCWVTFIVKFELLRWISESLNKIGQGIQKLQLFKI